jgi:hypothetical protein
MVIVIFLGIVFFWVGGIYLRRYFERKADAKRANMAATDAPYLPKDPNDTRSYAVPQMDSSPTGPVTALPAVSEKHEKHKNKLRSRSSSMSLGLGGSTRTTNTPQPVVWGPHQHLAHGHSTSNSPGQSVPPSPTYAVTHPVAPLRNRDDA